MSSKTGLKHLRLFLCRQSNKKVTTIFLKILEMKGKLDMLLTQITLFLTFGLSLSLSLSKTLLQFFRTEIQLTLFKLKLQKEENPLAHCSRCGWVVCFPCNGPVTDDRQCHPPPPRRNAACSFIHVTAHLSIPFTGRANSPSFSQFQLKILWLFSMKAWKSEFIYFLYYYFRHI